MDARRQIVEIALKQKISLIAVILGALYLLSDILLDLFFEFLDVAFEAVEFIFDGLIEHLFDTSRHTAQTITFYLLLLIGAYLLYKLGRSLPRRYDALKTELAVIRNQFTETARDNWHRAPISSRVKWGSAITIGMSMLMWGLLT